MIKKLLILIGIVAVTLYACNTNTGGINTANAVKVAVASFDVQAVNIVNKTVLIEGTVLHTCRHGGKRMFLVDGNDSVRVEVTAGNEIAKFDEKLTGSRLRVLGVLKEEKLDEKYLNDWENEVRNPTHGKELPNASHIKTHDDSGIQDKLDQINALRDDLKKSGKDHLSFYSIEASKFEEIKN